MDKFIISGGRRLSGEITVNGSKNASLPMMAASLLADGPLVLRDVPRLQDIDTMGRILQNLGVDIQRRGDRDMHLRVRDDRPYTAPYDLVSTMRASVCVLGPLLARRGRARVSLPGGCVIGVRPIDIHLRGLEALGARVRVEHGYVVAEARRLRGSDIYLGGAFGSSVTGTANILMAASLADGRSTIENAACEPEVQELAHLLNRMGADISGIGSPRLEIRGVRKLDGATLRVIPDRIEAGTFLAAGALHGGDVVVKNVKAEHLGSVLYTLRAMGVDLDIGALTIRARGPERLRPVDIVSLPYPGFPTDMQAQLLTLLTLADGISVVTEKIYPDRFMHVAELARMGAQIRKEGPCAIVSGVPALSGAPVMASDLRASAALVLAGLAAQGETEITRIYHIDRGYESVEKRLAGVGARIERVVDKHLIVKTPENSWIPQTSAESKG